MSGMLFAKSILAGLALAAPAGPVGIMCVQRTLTRGRDHGLASGLGAAIGDTFFAFIAALGIAWVSDLLTTYQNDIYRYGGVLIFFMGIYSLFSKPKQDAPPATQTTGDVQDLEAKSRRAALLWADGVSALTLTVTNPASLLAFASVFAMLGVFIDPAGGVVLSLLGSGVVVGGCVWWLGVPMIAGTLRSKMGPQHLVWVNRLAGVILMVFGVISFWSSF